MLNTGCSPERTAGLGTTPPAIKKEAKQCIFRMCTTTRPKWRSQALIKLEALVFNKNIVSMPTDNTFVECNFTKLYTVEIPSRDKWTDNQIDFKDEGRSGIQTGP
jgi:hypothetical protein